MKYKYPKDRKGRNCYLISFVDLPEWLQYEIRRMGEKVQPLWVPSIEKQLVCTPTYGNKIEGFGWRVYRRHVCDARGVTEYEPFGYFYSDATLGSGKMYVCIYES